MRIYLIGMPGVGKTRTGRELALKSNLKHYDLDELIVEKYGTISDIFNNQGEAYFREIESLELKNISLEDDFVLSCGGGVILDLNNKKLMDGIVIFLDADLSIISEHLAKSKKDRPILKKKSLLELCEERKDKYEYFFDYKIKYENSESAVSKILDIMKLEKKKVLVINGPNLNMLGKRDKNHYGSMTLDEINELMKYQRGFDFTFFQSNQEGLLVDKIQEFENYQAIIINPAAYTHTSVAIHDALEIVNIPKVEVHLSEVDNREDYRKINFVRDVCDKCFAGKHELSYIDAIIYIKNLFNVY